MAPRSSNPAQIDDDSPQAKRRKREEFERRRIEDERRRDAGRREMFTLFKMWTVCPDKRCKRARACAGDTSICLRARWQAVVPPELKALLSKFYRADGLTTQEALQAAERDIAEHEAAAAREALRAEAPPPPPPAPVLRRSESAPRRRFGPRVTAM